MLTYGKQYDTIPTYKHNPPTTREQLFYRMIFDQYYQGQDHVIPYFWIQFVENAEIPVQERLTSIIRIKSNA